MDVWEDGRGPERRESRRKIVGEESRSQRKNLEEQRRNFQDGGLITQQGLWSFMESKIREERGDLPTTVRETHRRSLVNERVVSFGKEDWKRQGLV